MRDPSTSLPPSHELRRGKQNDKKRRRGEASRSGEAKNVNAER